MNTEFDNARIQVVVDEKPEPITVVLSSTQVLVEDKPETLTAKQSFDNARAQVVVDEKHESIAVALSPTQVLVEDKPETLTAKPSSPVIRLSPGTIFQLGFMALSSIVLALILIEFGALLESLGNWGYLGVAAVEFGNSAMVAIPTPSYLYTFSMGAILNPFVIGIIGGTFATLGELIGYYLGRRGSAILPDGPRIERFKAWTSRWGTVTLFWFALLPVPFDIAGIWAGAARYPLVRFVPPVIVGKSIKITMIALAGFLGMDALTDLAVSFGI